GHHKTLDDPVAPDQLQRNEAAGRGETRAAVALDRHETEASEPLEHPAHARGGDAELFGDVGGGGWFPVLLYLIDDFEIVLRLTRERLLAGRVEDACEHRAGRSVRVCPEPSNSGTIAGELHSRHNCATGDCEAENVLSPHVRFWN